MEKGSTRRAALWARLCRLAEPRPPVAYAFAVLVALAALGLRLALEVATPGIVPFATLFPAVLAVALIGGTGPGIVAMLVGGVGAWYLLLGDRAGFGDLSAGEAVSLVLYAFSCLAIVVLAEVLRRALARIRRGDAERDRLAAILEATPDLVSMAEPDGKVVYLNAAARRALGVAEGSMPDRQIAMGHPARARPAIEQAVQAALAQGCWRGETVVLAADGREIPASLVILAHADGAASPSYLSTIARDISAERQAREALEAAHRFTSQVIASIVDPFYVVDREWRFTHVNEAFEQLSGRRREELLGRVVWEVFPETVGSPAQEANFRAVREQQPVSFETVSRVIGRWIESRVYPGEFGAAVYIRDITERKEAEERQQLLLAELGHRMKNTLAVVRSIAARSLSGERTLAEARDAITKRLAALANAHTALTEGGWRRASLRAVLEAELRPYGPRAVLAGPDLALSAKATQTFALVVHELATNAAKHGALSTATGRVEVRWELEGSAAGGEQLRILWRERDGPPVAPPAQRGFGTTLVEQGWRYELDGEVTLALPPDGLTCELIAPARTVLAAPSAAEAS